MALRAWWAVAAVALAGCAISLEPAAEGDAGSRDDRVVTDAIAMPADVTQDFYAPGTDTGTRPTMDVPATMDVPTPPADVPRPPRDAAVRDAPIEEMDPIESAPCTTDSDCGGAPGAMCLTQWPGGLCTRQCTNDRTCGENGVCFQNVCLPRCIPTQHDPGNGTITVPGGGECDGHGELCYAPDPATPGWGVCFPSCNVPMDLGVPACVTGTSCDLDVGACLTPAERPVGTLDVGSPCSPSAANTPMDCKSGVCLTDSVRPDPLNLFLLPIGFVDGYCSAVAIQLDVNEYQNSQPIPRSNCPVGSVMLPQDPSLVRPGDPEYCYKQCQSDSDCRPGYECFGYPQPDAGNFFSDGACLPINCGHDRWATAPNGGCPANSMCAAIGTRGVCTQ